MDLLEFGEKIEKLKQYHLDSAPEAVAQLNDWERGMRRLMQENDYLSLDITKQLLAGAKTRVREMSMVLSFKQDLTENERIRLFERRAAYLWFVKMFAKDYEKEIADIMEAIEYELEIVPAESSAGGKT